MQTEERVQPARPAFICQQLRMFRAVHRLETCTAARCSATDGTCRTHISASGGLWMSLELTFINTDSSQDVLQEKITPRHRPLNTAGCVWPVWGQGCRGKAPCGEKVAAATQIQSCWKPASLLSSARSWTEATAGPSHCSGFILSHFLGLQCLFMYKSKGVILVPWPWQYLTILARNGFCQKIFSQWASLVSQG